MRITRELTIGADSATSMQQTPSDGKRFCAVKLRRRAGLR